jgi:DNA primase
MAQQLRETDDIRRVQDATDIVRLVGEHVRLKPRGREFVGLCPFHPDHNPSMCVVPAKQIFHCFVCGAGGNCFSFAQKYYRMSFGEALRFLAQRASIELTPLRARVSDRGESGETTREGVLRANAVAVEFFRTILRHPEHGESARAVIAKRGISEEMSERFALGASPDRWDGLLLTLRSKGLDPGVFADAGLLKTRESGGQYDAFRNRLMFTITDQIGRPIAFGGRKIREEDEPKYLNSPETRVFSKSSTLYGLQQASRAIQTSKVAVVTEGYTDTIACHQAGVENVVATLGTALTREHAAMLGRLCETVVLLFDGDDAGQRAADRSFSVFFAEPVDVKIATLARVTDAKDPDELLKREGGAQVLRRAFDEAMGLIEYFCARVRAGCVGQSPTKVARAAQEAVEKLADAGLAEVPPVRRQRILRQLADSLGVDESTLRQQLPAGRGRSTFAPDPRQARGADDASVGDLARIASGILSPREHLLGCVLADGSLWLRMTEVDRNLMGMDAYDAALLRLIAQAVHDAAEDAGEPSFSEVSLRLMGADQTDALGAATSLAERVMGECGRDAERLRQHHEAILNNLKRPGNAANDGVRRSLVDLVELKRKEHASGSADRKVLPRPQAGGPRAGGGP